MAYSNQPEINNPVEIKAVANGFMVHTSKGHTRGDYLLETALVFQSFAALVEWLATAFPHRDNTVVRDTGHPRQVVVPGRDGSVQVIGY